ncbi:hypothetical protein Trihar35433_819 [Trichoderma harzianum]|nr:hypothetical protein Trihar35433_819 [Trichoderma harzianum]
MEGAKGARKTDTFSFKVIDSAIDALRNAVRYRMPRRNAIVPDEGALVLRGNLSTTETPPLRVRENVWLDRQGGRIRKMAATPTAWRRKFETRCSSVKRPHTVPGSPQVVGTRTLEYNWSRASEHREPTSVASTSGERLKDPDSRHKLDSPPSSADETVRGCRNTWLQIAIAEYLLSRKSRPVNHLD